jgi:hypothetical protein
MKRPLLNIETFFVSCVTVMTKRVMLLLAGIGNGCKNGANR